jgi:hypothetical protein
VTVYAELQVLPSYASQPSAETIFFCHPPLVIPTAPAPFFRLFF